MFHRLLTPMILVGLLLGTSADADDKADRPNVLIILADDLGFADLGSYGGDIQTPNLDWLADNGLRFTQFYTAGRGWISRASLLTGYYHDQLGAHRPNWAKTLPQRLKPAGYRSYHSGKWDLARWFDEPIADAGFDRSYHYADSENYFWPTAHYLDGRKLNTVDRDGGFYATKAQTDYMIDFLEEHAEQHADKPFFAFLAYNAPHLPLQAEQEDIDKYADQYTDGWDARRARIFVRQRQLGLIETDLSPLEPKILAPSGTADQRRKLGDGEVPYALRWFELTEEQQKFQSMKMRIYAAMVDRMDREIGRVLMQLRRMGAYGDTLVLFMSDSGASAEIMVRGDGHDPGARPGSGDTYLSLGPGWSSASNTPFRRHKIWMHEGGIATPLIAHWPRSIRDRSELRHEPGHLIDLMPTILNLAGLEPENPADKAPPLPGTDLLPVFLDESGLWRRELFFNHAGNRALRQRDWKIVSSPMDGGGWALYDLTDDRAEKNDVGRQHPEKLLELTMRWELLNKQYLEDAAK